MEGTNGSTDEQHKQYILLMLDKLIVDHVDNDKPIADYPELFKQIQSYLLQLPFPEIFQKVPLVITKICRHAEEEAIKHMLQEQELISMIFVNFSTLPPPYQDSVIDMIEVLVNNNVRNALNIGSKYILLMIPQLLTAEYQLVQKILHVIMYFVCDRTTAIEVGPNILMYLTSVYPNRYDVRINDGIFRILTIICDHDVEFCEHFIKTPFFTTEVKEKFDTSTNFIEQELRVSIFDALADDTDIAKELHKMGIVKLVFEKLPVLDIKARIKAVTFLLKMCSYTNIVSQLEKDWCMDRTIGMLRGPQPQSIKTAIVNMLATKFAGSRQLATYLLEHDIMNIANGFFVYWQGSEDIIVALVTLIENLARTLGHDVIANYLDFPALASVQMPLCYNLLMNMIPCCRDAEACIKIVKVQNENENIIDRALIQLLEIVSTSEDARIQFVQSRAIRYLVHLMQNPPPYEFRGHLLYAISQCFPGEILRKFDDSWVEPNSESLLRDMMASHSITVDKRQILRDALMVDIDAPDGQECLVQKLQQQRKNTSV